MTTLTPLAEMLRLDGKTAIVTGGARGIGRGIAVRLIEAGASVVISDIDDEAGQESADATGAEFVHTDVACEEDLQLLLKTVIKRHGSVEILVNNAGIFPVKPALELSAKEWDQVQDINLRAMFLLSRDFANAAIERGAGGTIVNIGSIDSFHPSSVGLAAYDASKAGVLMFTRSFALEVASAGIRVNMIAPGGIATKTVKHIQQDLPEELSGDFLSHVPLGRWGKPDDIATMALVLASPLSAYVTGAAILVDGGRLLN